MKMPVQNYKTYQMLRPFKTHFVKASCAEVNCEPYTSGWQLRVESLSEEDLYLATHCGRSFKRVYISENETYLVYSPGQPCFRSNTHTKPVAREAFYLVRDGYWKNYIGKPIVHSRVDFWVEDFSDNQDKVNRIIQRG